MAKCPAHDDRVPSLSITERDGKVLLKCFAGCGQRDIIEALKTRGLWEPERRDTPRIVATYDYANEEGKLLFQTVRYEPKNFKQRRPDGKGNYIWNLHGVRLVPYNLPEVLSSEVVIIVEGERDVHTLEDLGFVATCGPMGAGKWKPEYARHFQREGNRRYS